MAPCWILNCRLWKRRARPGSSPVPVTTANQKPALIEQGTEIPYVESSSSRATSVTFKKAVLSLKVTPQITPDNRVILDLTVTQDTKGETVPTGTGDAVSINAQSITTQVLVNNGETLVLMASINRPSRAMSARCRCWGYPGWAICSRKPPVKTRSVNC